MLYVVMWWMNDLDFIRRFFFSFLSDDDTHSARSLLLTTVACCHDGDDDWTTDSNSGKSSTYAEIKSIRILHTCIRKFTLYWSSSWTTINHHQRDQKIMGKKYSIKTTKQTNPTNIYCIHSLSLSFYSFTITYYIYYYSYYLVQLL